MLIWTFMIDRKMTDGDVISLNELLGLGFSFRVVLGAQAHGHISVWRVDDDSVAAIAYLFKTSWVKRSSFRALEVSVTLR